jgi:hypothetical protein
MGIYAALHYEVLMMIAARIQHKFLKTKETKRQVSIFNNWTIKTQRDAMENILYVFYWSTLPTALRLYSSKYIDVLQWRTDTCAQS